MNASDALLKLSVSENPSQSEKAIEGEGDSTRRSTEDSAGSLLNLLWFNLSINRYIAFHKASQIPGRIALFKLSMS